MLNKNSFSMRKPTVKRVEVPEWGEFAYIKKISAAERAKFMQSTTKIDGTDVTVDYDRVYSEQIRFLQLCLCDEQGIRVLSDSDEDFELLSSQEGDVVQMLCDAALDFNGLGADSEKEAIKN